MRIVSFDVLFALLILHVTIIHGQDQYGQLKVEEQNPDQNGFAGNSYDPSISIQPRPQWSQNQLKAQTNIHGAAHGILQYPGASLSHSIQIGGQQDAQGGTFIIPPAHFLTQADIETDGKLKTVELIKKYGYPVETHFVTTRDGYKLCMHRMPRPGAQPILLVHGLMSSSAAWVMLGPSNGLAYILFQQGYDVWMLNTRGNIYSKEHTKKGITMKEYWDFSFHDIGTIDVPSSIDLILERTHFHQIQYIGHSQGSTVFFVMCSELPEYSGKVKLMQALSPTVYMKQTRSPVLKFISFFKGPLLVLLNLLGGHEISLNTKLIQQFRNHICSANEITSRICGIFDFVLCGFNWDSLNRTLTPIIVGHASQGASTKQIHHYAQLHRNLYFRRFDHGPIRNRIRYQSLTPPSYNLSQTQCKVVLHHGAKDWLASGSDVTNLQDRLPNCIESRKVKLESFTHFDFVISKDVRSLVYNRVVDLVVTNQIQPQRPDEGSSHDPSTPSQLIPQWNQGQSEAEINVHGDRVQGILQNPNLNWSLQHPIQIVGQQDVQQETLFEPRPVQVDIKLQRPDENGFTGNSYDPSTPSQLIPQWNQGQSEAEINVHGDRAQGILQNPNLNWSLQHPIQIVGQQDVQQETLFEPRPVQVDIKLQRPDENGFTANSYDPSTPSQLRPQWNQGQSEVEINVHGDRVQGIPQNPNINWSLQHPIQIGGQQDVQQERFIIPPAQFLTQADIETDGKLKTVELIKKYGYPVETHFVTTRDGYKLCMHRMPRPGAQPILLVHGLMSSSAAWVMLGPSNGLAYILFQQGYDVWMLNTRGNIYSKEHTKKWITMKEYWDFSFHDIGTIDVPSSIDLILERTHFHQIQYIGHSQGSTVFFVMCSELPEYSGKVKLMQALSPTVYMKQTRSPVLKFISFFKGPLLVLLDILGGHEISLNTKLIQQFRNHICSANEITSRICGIFDFVLCGFNWDSLNRTLTPIIVGHASQGASTKQIHHYAQLHRNLYFRRFDHGPIRNRIRYQSLTPPSYNLSQTQCKVVLHHGAKDWLASGSDVTNLQDRLPNCIESRKVEFESFTHFDFVISKDVRSLVYNRVVDLVVTNQIQPQRPDEGSSHDPSTPSQLRPQWNQGQSEAEINVHGDRVQGFLQNPNLNWSIQHPIQIVGQQDVQQETLFEPRPVQVDIKLQRPGENGSTGNSYDPSTPSQLRPQWNQGQSEVEINVHGDRVQGIPQNPNINWSLQHPIQIGGQQDVQQERFIIPPAHFLTQADIETDGKLKTVELIKKYGYPVETHFVTTRDGYKLCMHRMPRPGAQPILLVHGLMSSSAAWVMLGPSNGLAYILFQQGYDVWMLNTRGNIYSKEHTKKGITMKEYWDFSFHDIGTIDVPSSIDLILERTHFHQIQYIGHSQGSTVFFVMCSELPEYSGKVKLMQALSPTVYMKQTRSPVLKFISFFKGPLLVLLNLLGGHEISLNTKLIQQFRNHICSANEITSRICGIFDFVLCGFNWDSLNRTLTPIIVGHASQGASTKQIHHYAQLHRNLYFRRFDHGPIRNRIRYQSLSPPSYNLSQTQCRVVLHHGAKDWLASGSDVTNLQDRLPNCIESRKVEFESFTHFDFVISKDVRSLVYNRVVDLVVTNQIQPQRPDENGFTGNSYDPSTPSQLRPQWNQGQSEAEINVHGDRAQGILQNPNLNWSLQHPIQIVGQQDVQQETLFEPRPVQVDIKLQRPDENGFTGNSYDPSTPSQLRPQWNQGQSEVEINVHGDRVQGIPQNPNINWSLQHPIQIGGQQDVQQERFIIPPAHFLTQADIETDGKLKTVELIKKYGYPVETHFVTTRDGYKLCMHRMPRPGAQPILLVHGLMSSSAAWVMLGPSNGLAYILFQQGYDVWMLNTRGNIYSKEHTKKGITMKEYWDFSFHDIGTIDVPSSIDLILERTHFHQIQYIGHSQGSTVFFVMCSELPEYSGKVKLMQALSPTVYMKQTRSPVLKFISFFKGPLLVLLNLLGGHEISLNTKLIQQFRNHICSANEITSRICGIFDFVLCGFNWDSLNRTLTPIIVGHASQGASTKQIHHYAQLHRNLYFRRFDHGPIRNRIRYQSLSPPSYNLSQTQCRVVLHHGAKDWLASGSDVTNLQDRLPNCIESRKVKLESFTHFDFVISKDVRSLVYNRVIDLVVKT
ncbi:uncharacterized protein [Drosophila pseudoobscura]|uniref:Uncharacterized protein isoform X3 n=1 Tax=Drosophila pseudoobscura pseudoobscura TaxID=46245 RepID=A0A6I8VWX9_DROPS|nr:uncharacterized protein LOC6902571 isoform X3 [Drosophila pseudoobscura]